MTPCSIFIVDDEKTIREGVTMSLATDYEVEAFPDAETAIEAMRENPPDLVLLDIGLPGMTGIDALEEIKRLNPAVLVVMITAFEDVKTVVSAMKLGAYDYVVKPIHMDTLELTIQNALETVRLRKEVQSLQERYLTENIPCFIAESDAIQDVMDLVGKVAESPDTPILIIGETGTGKELIASAVHYRSPNFRGPFVTVNCAAIPKDLIESELFGYGKGAFSGARTTGKKGLIEEAANGTLFLDEVGDLSLEAQAKLLRFLEEGEFYRVGETKQFGVQTRVVSATNKNVDEMMEKGLLRKDLYFRLGVIKIQVPSLNQRREDILPLTKHFLFQFSEKFGKTFTGISPQAEKALRSHQYVGNVRELRNLVERAVLTSIGPVLTPLDFGFGRPNPAQTQESDIQPLSFPSIPPDGLDLVALERALERHFIEEAYRLADGNESRAARMLKLNHHTFRYRRKKLQSE